MHYAKINKLETANGPGIRVCLYVQGCRNHCEGCFNKRTWDFNAGQVFTFNDWAKLRTYLDHDYIKGLTICGGEPMELENQRALYEIAYQVKKDFPDKDIWCYTGYWYEDLLLGGKQNFEYTNDLLRNIDVLIDGPFVLEKRDITDNNRWRGSTNQRVIDVKKSLAAGHAVPLDGIPNNNF